MAMLARDVMEQKVVTVEPALPAAELEALLDREGISGVPVVEKEQLVGVVSRADLARAQTDAADRADAILDYYREAGGSSPAASERARLTGERLKSLRVRDLMTSKLVTVAASDPIAKVAESLASHGIHRVLVADDGRLRGLISSLDIVRLVAEGRLRES